MRQALLALTLVACGGEPPVTAGGLDDVVLASAYPVAYLAERLAGEDVSVRCPLPEGSDPATWRPSSEDLQAFQRARLVVLNGADFEAWVETASLPDSRVVNASAGFRDDLVSYESVSHSHGPGGEHTHEGVDGHTWMDPLLCKAMAGAIRDGMKARWPAHAPKIEQRFAALADDLDELHGRLASVTERLGTRQLLANHPAYNYLVARHGWRLKNLDLDPAATTLDTVGVREVEDATEAARAPILLWEAPPTPELRALLERDYGLTQVVYTPAEALTSDQAQRGEDWLRLMHDNVDRLERAVTN